MRTRRLTLVTSLALLSGASRLAAQAAESDWGGRLAVYGYLPSISLTTRYPSGGSGPSISVSGRTLLPDVRGAFMGLMSVQYRTVGVRADWVYTEVRSDITATRDVAIEGVPAGAVTADLGLDATMNILTLTGTWTAVRSPSLQLEVLAGARLLSLRQTFSWEFLTPLPPDVPVPPTGLVRVPTTNWDAVAGVSGRFRFGGGKRWFVPFLADAGTGASSLTWQGLLGLGYEVGMVDIAAAWRYIDYDMKEESLVTDLSFSGPLLGVQFRF